MCSTSQSGATSARILSAWRTVSPTHSRRFTARIAARTCVESVLCFPRSLTHPRSRKQESSTSKRRRSACFVNKRLRNSLRTEKSKPASVISKLKAYFQSIRVLTASAACLSVNPSAYCITITRARRQADSAGCPFSENKSRKSSSRKNVPNSFRIWM
jgi:hypothetical protein